MTHKVVCIGTLIVDIINAALDRLLYPNEGVATTIEIELGGNAFNVAVDLMKLGLQHGEAMCVGAVGDDYLGTWFLNELNHHGVIPQISTIQGKRTAKNLILQVKGEERRYHYDEGATVCLDAESVTKILLMTPPEILYIGEIGSLGDLYPNLKHVLSTAKRQKCLTVVDVVIPPNEEWGALYDAAPFIDVLHCNNYEARSFTRCTEMPDVMKKLIELGIALPIVSQGADSLICHYHGLSYTIPTFNVKHVDSTGAGDAFTAGLIKKFLEFEGKDLQTKFGNADTRLLETLLFGSAAGAICVTALGCTPAVSKNAVLQLLERQSEAIVSNIMKHDGF